MIRRFRHYFDVGRASVPRRVFLRREYDRMGGYVGALAREYRKRLLPRVRLIAVVGSLGKSTTTRALRAAIPAPERNFSPHNYGTSLAHNVLRIRPWDKWAALETGIEGPGKMAYYSQLLRPDVVVVTSIHGEHKRSFSTLIHTREEKVKMLRALTEDGLALLNGDDENVLWMATQSAAKVVTYGLGESNRVRGTGLRHDSSGRLTFDVELASGRHTLRSRLIGEHMVYPLLAAIALCDALGLDMAAALTRLSKLEPTPSRLQLIDLPGGVRVLDDSFKGGIESVQAALRALSRIEARRRVVVLGDIEEAPKPEGEAYREIGEQVASVADVLVCVGGNRLETLRAAACRAGLPREATFTPGKYVPNAIPLLRELVLPGDVVLVKGAHAQRLQRLVLSLQGREVTCGVRYCNVKARCDYCPLVSAGPEMFSNPLVARYIKEPGP